MRKKNIRNVKLWILLTLKVFKSVFKENLAITLLQNWDNDRSSKNSGFVQMDDLFIFTFSFWLGLSSPPGPNKMKGTEGVILALWALFPTVPKGNFAHWLQPLQSPGALQVVRVSLPAPHSCGGMGTGVTITNSCSHISKLPVQALSSAPSLPSELQAFPSPNSQQNTVMCCNNVWKANSPKDSKGLFIISMRLLQSHLSLHSSVQEESFMMGFPDHRSNVKDCLLLQSCTSSQCHSQNQELTDEERRHSVWRRWFFSNPALPASLH